MDAKDDGFEKGVKRLQKIVAQLEEGDLPLEKGLALFREGAALAKSCRDRLSRAKIEVETATREAAGVSPDPPDPPDPPDVPVPPDPPDVPVPPDSPGPPDSPNEDAA